MPTVVPTVSGEKTSAEQLLADLKLEGVFPVPLESVAKQLGYDSLVFDPNSDTRLQDVAGMVNYSEKKIFVNGADHVLRQRFTLAHEIGHIVLHSGSSVVDYRRNIDTPATPNEVEANKFAADLLMPPIPFIKEWLATGGTVELLSRKFGVSPAAVQVRAGSFKLNRG